MFTKATSGLTVVLVTASGAMAATKTQSPAPIQAVHAQNVYNPADAYVGSDPDRNVRFELNRDWARSY